MSIEKNKKAQIYTIIYTLLLLFSIWGVSSYYFFLIGDAECSQLKPTCSDEEYCGVDFSCHTIQGKSNLDSQTEINRTYTVFPGIIFILFSLIVAFFILRGSLWKR